MRNDNKKLYTKFKASRDELGYRILATPRGHNKTNLQINQLMNLCVFSIILNEIETSKTKLTQEDVLNIIRKYADVKEEI